MASHKTGRRKKSTFVTVTAVLIIIAFVATIVAAALVSLPSGTGTQGMTSQDIASMEKSYQDQLKNLEDAANKNADNADIWAQLGNTCYGLAALNRDKGQMDKVFAYYAQAVEAYQKSLALKPDNVNVRVDMATAAFYSNQLDLAETEYKKAMEIDPKHHNARFNYGIFLLQARNNPSQAIAAWEALLALNPPKEMQDSLNRLISTAKLSLNTPAPNNAAQGGGSGNSTAPNQSGPADGASGPAPASGTSGNPDFSGLSKLEK